MVDHGLRALGSSFRDPANGGWYAQVGPHGPIDDRCAGCPACLKCRPIDKELEKRTWLPSCLIYAIELACLVVTATNDCKYGAVVRHRDERGLPNLRVFSLTVERLHYHALGNVLK